MTEQPELWTFVKLTNDEDAIEVARDIGGGVERSEVGDKENRVGGHPTPAKFTGTLTPDAPAATLSRTLTIIRDVLLRGPVTMAALRQHVADNHKWMLETTVSARLRDLRNLHGYDVRWNGSHYWIEP